NAISDSEIYHKPR
ncbi:MAG: hypothetical protein RLZZ425_694, partial [Bacteroidota bacterium]